MIDLEKQLIRAIEDDNLDLVKSLLDQGASVDAMDTSGFHAIHVAVQKRNKSIIELLLNRGASAHSTNYYGNVTPLLLAVERKNADVGIVKVLLDNFDKEAMDALSVDHIHLKIPLHIAAFRGNLEVVRLFLERGVRVGVQDTTKHTALHRASLRQGNGLMMSELLQRSCYSYPSDKRDQLIEKYWESNPINTPADELLYTSMILAGVTVRMKGVEVRDKALEAQLTTVQRNIISTVVDWLAPLALSSDEVCKATPAVLRALPRLIHWLDCVDSSASKKLGPWLFKKVEKGKKDEALEALFTRLDKIPTELKDLVREDFNQSTLADLLVGRLEKIYGLEKCIAQYLVTKVMGHLEEYRAFHARLWEHDWASGMCEPPMVRSHSTAEVTDSLQSLRC